ncbi:type IV pili twitching motility protein PilT, partial [Microcoleus sp. K4-C2]
MTQQHPPAPRPPVPGAPPLPGMPRPPAPGMPPRAAGMPPAPPPAPAPAPPPAPAPQSFATPKGPISSGGVPTLKELVIRAKEEGVSDLHLGVNEVPRFRTRGE